MKNFDDISIEDNRSNSIIIYYRVIVELIIVIIIIIIIEYTKVVTHIFQ